MLLLLPLLLSVSLVTAAPRHLRLRDSAKSHTATTTTTILDTVYGAADILQPTGAPPSIENDAKILPESDKSYSKKSGDTTLQRMSSSDVSAIYKTCWNGQLQWPLPGMPNPCLDVVAAQLNIFPLPITKPDTLTVHNYCSYNIYFNHFQGANMLESGNIAAGAKIDRPLFGSVLKVSKTPDMAKDVLVEYAVADGRLYYDLSLITCLGRTNGVENGDTSACAGHEAGLQLGNSKSKSFQCAAGAWCDDQAYLYQENLCKKQNPVWSCNQSDGLTMEFCASQRR
ncbi:uncharacterized protein K460DRAFT_52514 [Cucurbitaria berberidis CBS 394.84]|uniref:Uncharacterized protein n=1 Tax=Cucurbitaria berberidis CBS 394.84 TaxID=1168544 RepID=A0A9P4GIY8_9PLEO|nr:uncharacterized protein K460DRAFT_52514 [Cucurbitaria berberidis CBS 394.84]KAF1847053.1 hypothetical protein K460DRAFT_52514 [Cucurbitaria berberidis CBS 394.84]